MERYYTALRAVVAAHGGTVVKLLGDGVMAAFGLKQVAEDDALRAVPAGLAMQEIFRALRAEVAALGEVGLRVAVNTGEVVVGGAADDVIGDPVNVAARLQEQRGGREWESFFVRLFYYRGERTTLVLCPVVEARPRA